MVAQRKEGIPLGGEDCKRFVAAGEDEGVCKCFRLSPCRVAEKTLAKRFPLGGEAGAVGD